MPNSNNGRAVYDGLIARGFSPVQASVIAGNAQQESSFNPDAWNADSSAGGLMQWRGSRLQGLQQYAASTGRAPNDLNAQLDYIASEMTGPEAKNSAAFLAAPDVASANNALRQYLRYGPTEGGNRLQYSQAFADQGNGGGMTQLAVNPVFNGAMPSAPTGAPAQPPAPPSAPAQPAISDDDLLNAFLKPGTAAAASGNSDDALLQQFLPKQASKSTVQSDPLANTQQLFPGADALSALFTSGVDAIPVVGHPLMTGLENVKAGVNRLMGGNQSASDVAAVDKAVQQEQPVASTAGSVIGTVAPYVVAPELIPGAGTALGMSGNLLTRMGMGALSGSLLQGADTITRGGSLEQAKNNALLGGALGAGAAPVADLISGGINRLTSGASPEIARLAQVARDKYGIPIGPGQISDNSMVRYADSVVNKMPLSGGTASNAAQQSAFNRAVANTFGENATSITPDVMAQARNRIGEMFNSVAGRTPMISYDGNFEQALGNLSSEANQVLTPQELTPLRTQVDGVLTKFAQGDGAIDGATYQALTRKGAPLDRLINSDNSNLSYFGAQLRDALDDALERSAPPDALQDLQQARSQYHALKTVEPLAAKAPTGDISPSLLMGRVNSNYSNTAYGAGGDLAELGRIGQQFLKSPPSSGTAERLAVMELGKKALGGAGIAGAAVNALFNPGSIPMMAATGIPAALGYAGLARGAGALMRSPGVANMMIRNALQDAPASTGGVINQLTRSASPLIANDNQQPLMITVRGGANQLTGQ